MDILDAAYNVGIDAGVSALAPRIGKNPTTLTQELNRTGGAKLGLLTALKMTHQANDLRILQSFAKLCGQMLIPLPDLIDTEADSRECMRRLAHLNGEFGKVAADVCESLSDGTITPAELTRYRKLCSGLMAAIHGLDLAMLAQHERSRAEAGFPPIEGAASQA